MIADRQSGAGPAFGDPGRFAPAVRVLEEAISARAFPGCAYGVFAGGNTILEGALGRFTYDEDGPQVTVETVFDVASLTKVVATTAAAMLLVQRKQLDLETRVGDVLPEFVADRGPGDPAHGVTIRNLLAHNSGLPGYVEFFRTASTAEELLRTCFQLQLEAAPGTRAEYSDPGFILLGEALEAVIGEDLSSWTRREIFELLEMKFTGFSPAPALRREIPPTEEDTTFRQRRIQGEVQDENAWVLGGVAGHAGLFSCVRDLLRFSVEILRSAGHNAVAGTSRLTSLFEAKIVEQFAERQAPEGSSRALGWDTPSAHSSSGDYFSQHSIGHLGYSGCSLWIDLDAAIAVVLLTNRTWPDRKSQFIKQVRPAFHNSIRKCI